MNLASPVGRRTEVEVMASEARGRWMLGLCVVVALAASPAMGALDVSNLHVGFFLGGYVVNDDLEFSVSDMGTGGVLRVDGEWDYSLQNCLYELSECPLIEDLTPPPGGDPVTAAGRFSDKIDDVAATLTITGDIHDDGGEIFSGVVLEAEVRGSFLGTEVFYYAGKSDLDFSLTMEITGGELSGRIDDGQETDLKFANPMLDAIHTFLRCDQAYYPGQGVVDFEHSIENSLMAGNVHINAVPEPTCMLLLGIGAFGMYARRKR